jgi:hypothetical protein
MLVICISLNFIGQMTFYCPLLVLNLRRTISYKHCLLMCIKHSKHKSKRNSTKEINQEQETQELNDRSCEQTSRKDEQLQSNEERKEKSSTNKSTSPKFKLKKLRDKKIDLFSLIFESKFKYILLLIFLANLIFNLVVIIFKHRINIPVADIIPVESYLSKHMLNHQYLYNVGPIIKLSFIKPLDYWNKTTYHSIRSFMNEAKSLKDVDSLFEMNWLQDTILTGYDLRSLVLHCRDPFNFACFRDSFNSTLSLDMYQDDAIFYDRLNQSEIDLLTDQSKNASIANIIRKKFKILASRFYIQFQNFFGTLNELNVMHKLESMAKRYGFERDILIIYSPVYVFLEQLDETIPTLVAVLLLTFEALVLVSFALFCEPRSIIIVAVIQASTLVSIMGTLFCFNFSVNAATLVHLITLPTFMCEFYLHMPYAYLNPDEHEATDKSKISRTTIAIENSRDEPVSDDAQVRYRMCKIAFNKSAKHTSYFLLNVIFFNLFIITKASTYTFQTLVLFLGATVFNLCLHLYLFYPLMFAMFGVVWRNSL